MILLSMEICVSCGKGSQTCVEITLLKSRVCVSVSVTSALMPFNTLDVLFHACDS